MLGFGCGVGWFSPALPLLLSPDTPLSSGPLTVEQLSWSGSILSIGGVMGSLLCGFLMSRIGTKRTLMLLAIPQLVNNKWTAFSEVKILTISIHSMFVGFVGIYAFWNHRRSYMHFENIGRNSWRRNSHLHVIVFESDC